MTYQEIKETTQNKLTKIYKDNQVFFAFSSDQLKEGKKENNIPSDGVIVAIGVGGYLPIENSKSYAKDIVVLEEWRKKQMQELGENAKELEIAIHYELSNFECWYTGDVSIVCGIFPDVAKADIERVYAKFVNIEIN